MDATPGLSLEQLDQRSLLHPLTSIADHAAFGPLVVATGHGTRVRDRAGREYLDAAAGLWCVNVGYGRRELADAAAAEMARLGFFHTYAGASNEPAVLLADRLLGLAREQIGLAAPPRRVFFGTSGSDAVDTAIKLVRAYSNLRGLPRKKTLLARHGAFHGLTIGSGSLTGIPFFHAAFDLPVGSVRHLTPPYAYGFARDGETEEAFCARLARELEERIVSEGADTVAALFVEPIMGAGGVLVPPRGYFQAIRPVLDRHDVLLVADEVITGFGRTGQWFASRLYGLQPDLVVFSKGLTSGYFPLSAVVIGERVWRVFEETSRASGPFAHGYTYTGHPVGGAVGLANLDVIEREGLVANAAVVGAHLQRALEDALCDHPFVGEVRGEGLLLGVEITADRATRRPFARAVAPHRAVARRAMAHGLLVRGLTWRDVVSFSPPLTLTRAEAEEVAGRFAAALRDVTPELAAAAGGA